MACSHMSPEGPLISGQWDINGTLHLICTSCAENRSYKPDTFEAVADLSYRLGNIGGQGERPRIFIKRTYSSFSWKTIWAFLRNPKISFKVKWQMLGDKIWQRH